MADLSRIQNCEQQLLQGLEVVIKVVEQLNSGKPEGVRQLCADFVQGAKESQAVLLELADKYEAPLPFEPSNYTAKIRTLAAEKQVEAAQARLQQLRVQQQLEQQQQVQQPQQ